MIDWIAVAAAGVVVAAIGVGVRASLRAAVRDGTMDKDRAWRIGFRLAFLVVAMVVLVVVCREGTSPLAVGFFFTVYVAAATLWIRGQHQASIDAAQGLAGPPWTMPYWISLPAVGVGLAFGVAGAVLHVSTALVSGALLFYFGIGYALMRFRIYGTYAEGRRRVKIARWGLLGSGVLVIAGLLALEHVGFALWVLGLGVLLVPAGLSLRAEPAIRSLHERGQRRRALGLAGWGLVLVVADAGLALLRIEHVWVLVAFLALALLVLAIVSSTQADIATVIAAVALMGVTSLSEDKPEALTPQRDDGRVLVSLGDSYMAGEGADIFYKESSDENHCSRAPTAWAAMAGQTKRLFDSVAFLACSGARTYNVRHGMTPQYDEPGTQLDQADDLKAAMGAGFTPSLVVVSLGGNDAGFSTIGMMCLAPGDCSEAPDLWVPNLEKVGTALEETYAEIRAEFPGAPVLVVPYPQPIAAGSDPNTCDEVALSAEDMAFVRGFVRRLNLTVARAARAQDFYFLAGMEDALAAAHLQLCDPENDTRPGINFIGLRSVAGIAEQRFNPKNWYHNSLHPNERGHAAMLQVFEQWLAQHPTLAAPEVAGAADTGEITTKPLCDLFDDAESTSVRCTDAGADWAKGQVSDALLWRWWGLQILLATLGAWLFGVGLYGAWKPWWRRPGSG